MSCRFDILDQDAAFALHGLFPALDKLVSSQLRAWMIRDFLLLKTRRLKEYAGSSMNMDAVPHSSCLFNLNSHFLNHHPHRYMSTAFQECYQNSFNIPSS